GHRVVLITCTRGEMGEIVVPEMDTPENHKRLGEIRAGELERAMAHLGVTEWENLGYHDSDMMGRPGNHDPRTCCQADLDETITTWLDISGKPVEAKWAAIHEHVTQISDQSPFMLLGLEGWRDGWSKEAYILRESRVPSKTPETDLFAGIV